MRIADVNYNDMVNGEGVCLSIWFQGCPHHCPGCHNPETWSLDGGQEIAYSELKAEMLAHLHDNKILRNLSLLGGEPLCDENLDYALDLAAAAHQAYPSIKVYCWTGFTYEALVEKYGKNIFKDIDVLIDGPFILAQRDITLKLRGSKNQRVLQKNIDF